MAVPVAAIVKKAAEILANSKKGRKFIGYTVGIAVFLLLLPVIVIYGLFSWMPGGEVSIDQSRVIAALPSDQREVWQYQDEVMQRIADEFTERNLTKNIRLAQAVYYLKLTEQELSDADFCSKLADCFSNADADVYGNIQSAFGVTFSEQDIADLYALYSSSG